MISASKSVEFDRKTKNKGYYGGSRSFSFHTKKLCSRLSSVKPVAQIRKQ